MDLGGFALISAGLQSLTEGRKGPDAGFARKYMVFIFRAAGELDNSLKNKQTNKG